MNRRYLLLLVFALVLSASFWAVKHESVNAKSIDEERIAVRIWFTEPLEVETAVDWSNANSVTLLELQVQSPGANDTTATHGVVIPPEIKVAAIPDYYQHTLQDTLSHLLEVMAHAPGEDTSQIVALTDFLALIAEKPAPVHAGVVLVNALELSTLNESPYVVEVEAIPISGAKQDNETNLANCSSPWYPNAGYVSVGPATNYRAAYQVFRWNTDRLDNLKACSNVTYEAELWLNNYDSRRYLGSVRSWSSTMPNGYLDTNALDNPGEISYTVGTSRASNLSANTSYNTWIETNVGNSSSDTAKVMGQRGERVPSWCDSTWCIFGRATRTLVPAWQLNVPGNKSWSN